MTPQEARALVAALPQARERWLAQAVAGVEAQAVWLAGYFEVVAAITGIERSRRSAAAAY